MTPRSRLLVAAMLVAVVALVVGGVVLGARRDTAPEGSTDLEQLGRYGEVPSFVLTERSGRRVTTADLRGSVWVVDFIYTECTETCPTQSLKLAQLQREFSGTPDLRLVSITVDPAHDTPRVLRAYAERYGASERWWFLTGDKREISCLAREGFRLGVTDPRSADVPDCSRSAWLAPSVAWASHGSHGIVMHSARMVLVDRAGQIRAYHLATDRDSMTRLRANLRRLLQEPATPAR
jgi:cytochrome oxidase Cu insertion factor (SCO1/SenC/PrrC family)